MYGSHHRVGHYKIIRFCKKQGKIEDKKKGYKKAHEEGDKVLIRKKREKKKFLRRSTQHQGGFLILFGEGLINDRQ